MQDSSEISNDFAYEALPRLAEDAAANPELLGRESYEWSAIANLDHFFTRIYRYYEEKGFSTVATARICNLLALGFTVCFSGFLLMVVDWHGVLHSDCLFHNTCEIQEVGIIKDPLAGPWTTWKILCVIYLLLFSAYWLYNLIHVGAELKTAADIHQFTTTKLGLSERQLQTVSWPNIARRLVEVQNTTRLSLVRDLTEHDVVSRIMRKENYLIGMLNRGVLALNVPTPGMRKRFMLTQTLEWNLQWCLFDCMFDERFRIRRDFLYSPVALQRRFRRMALCNLLVSPFLIVFLLIYFFMRNAERFYHQPSSIGARRWSPLAGWRLREFNELPHYIEHRLNASHKAAEKYISQFPSPGLSAAAKLVSYVAGSFCALFIFLAFCDAVLLERPLYGQNLVWWTGILGVILAISRAFIIERGTACEPELALLEVVAHTHWLPRHWRGRAHTQEVHDQFQQLFPFKVLLFLEEMASIVLTPFVLYFSLPKCAPAILDFVRNFTTHVEGVGDICSLAAFDFRHHGNSKYGSPFHCAKTKRSRQGKMEKSFLSFAATYSTWEPDAAAKQMLASLNMQSGPHLHGLPDHAPHLLGPAAVGARLGGWNVTEAAATSLHGARQVGRGGTGQAVGGWGALSLFQSAELPGHAGSGVSGSQALASTGLLSDDDRLAAGHMQLQTFYEDRQRQALQSPCPPSPPEDDPDSADDPQSTAHDRSSGLLVDPPDELVSDTSHPEPHTAIDVAEGLSSRAQPSSDSGAAAGLQQPGRPPTGGRQLWGPQARAGEQHGAQPLQRALWQRPQPLIQQPHQPSSAPQQQQQPQQQHQRRGPPARSRLSDVPLPVDSMHYLSRSGSSAAGSVQELESEMVALEPGRTQAPTGQDSS